ncbi:hypothetical protein [Staphylococcus coagulans]|uniref:hypothetical protein n=1 Tax=Staphylococcus coagulans TaxID=74706 RepID=UPI001FD94F55|nr:hypothetical protein [Staphylococcus coagulans]
MSLQFQQEQPFQLKTDQRKVLKRRLEFYISQKITKQLSPFITSIVAEVHFLAIQLLCISKDYDFYYDSQSFKDLMQISKMFIDEFEQNTNLQFKNKSVFIELIQTLMKVVHYRQFFGYADRCNMIGPLDEDVEVWIKLTKKLISSIANTKQFQEKFQHELSASDLLEFAHTIQSVYLENQTSVHHINIVVVANLSKVEQNILFIKLREIISSDHIYGSYSEREAMKLTQTFDLCITTSTHYNHTHCQTIHVNKNLTAKDYEVLYQLKQYRLTYQQRRSEIFQILNNHELTQDDKFNAIEQVYSPKFDQTKASKNVNMAQICPAKYRFEFKTIHSLQTYLWEMVAKMVDTLSINQENETIKDEISNLEHYRFLYPDVLLMHIKNPHITHENCTMAIAKISTSNSIIMHHEHKVINYIIVLISHSQFNTFPILMEIDEYFKQKKMDTFILDQ